MNQTATGPDRIAAELAADLDAGFAALFEAHQNVLFSTALRICGRWADAEDLTAMAFLRAFHALSGYDRDHPRADLLRYKSVTAPQECGCPACLSTKRAQTEVTKA